MAKHAHRHHLHLSILTSCILLISLSKLRMNLLNHSIYLELGVKIILSLFVVVSCSLATMYGRLSIEFTILNCVAFLKRVQYNQCKIYEKKNHTISSADLASVYYKFLFTTAEKKRDKEEEEEDKK